ncbi:Alpha/Beta hydrolase protein [Pelagophyceae sp. CCMP2097]|nr:Alpha/Beta hydrolase protein [Pelagophyceae sp. CCMP2097]|mmetsp:Transcript_15935/g.53722  ORF Transcript_15935/g.53722 Transcript_15935/m.53722 type:complete len:286 (-) Transcript_15935:691-1548(-)
MSSIINSLAFPVPPRAWSAAVLRRRADLIMLRTASGETTAAVHIRNARRASSPTTLTILYSHANAEDLALALPYADVLSRFCGCDVLAYEYCGYSISSGEASEAGCIQCVDAALAYLLEGCRLAPERIVVYGRSIGSGPTVDVASRHARLGGMVLQSAIASAGLVVLPEMFARSLAGYDVFLNYEKIPRVRCRTLMIHGRDDRMVPFDHALMLYPHLLDPHPPLWVDGAGHHDMPDELCLNAVASFVVFIEQRAMEKLGLRVQEPPEKPQAARSSSWLSLFSRRS